MPPRLDRRSYQDQVRLLMAHGNEDLVLDLIIEEASEVLQAAVKIKRFGPENRWPDKEAKSNAYALAYEGCQLGNLTRIYSAAYGASELDVSVDVSRKIIPECEDEL